MPNVVENTRAARDDAFWVLFGLWLLWLCGARRRRPPARSAAAARGAAAVANLAPLSS